ncbi:PepSY domain-containing protein [Micrococcus lacusdianchii]|uniref:PepSY domain-containing protein n=1 Tax=Micrococcus lacusdianchii TaxID=2915940 RepID=UPI00249DA73C|nr:PepSY domain-containing protein [Micrococcus sp. JXJ CY 30]
MADLKKTLSLSAGALLALTAVTGCGTQAENAAEDAASGAQSAAQDAASGAQSAASGAASAATSAVGAASSEMTDDDESSAASGAVADPDAQAAVDAVLAQHAGGTVTALDRDDDEDERWEVDVVVDDQVKELTVAADGTVTESETDDADDEDVAQAKDATVDVTAAIEAALEGRDGQVVDEVELDEDGDRLAWDISLDKADRQDADEVLVDAKTGEVVSTDG